MPDGYACQFYLINDSVFHAIFLATIPLDDSSLKGNPLELGPLEGDIPRSCGEIADIVAAAV